MNKLEVLSILDQYGLSAKKSLGQNFLCNDNVIGDILDLAELDKTTTCLEIGPGLGALSEKAVGLCGTYVAVEIDTRFQDRLSEVITEQGGTVLFKDYLALGKEDLPDPSMEPDVILSNLPYYVMTPIMLKVMKDFPSCRKLVFMVEEEALDRIFARPGTKQYGPLSILTDLFGKKIKCFNVDSGSFYPAPNTVSSVIEIVSEGNTWDPAWIGFVESAFALRRKTLVNSLSSSGKYSKESILTALKALGIKETVRSEELSPSDLVKMYEILNEGKDEN
ncbi:MAG: ribosomal RNA small subunit methyltransferase A [Clostridiales bacterium]|nr:ribosomal RNA small subunit methyltransferase A [Clostridiales bacterium]